MFDKYKYTYNETVNQAVSFSGLNLDHFTKVKADLLLNLAGKIFSDLSKISVLDVGCGIGNAHFYLKNKFKSLSGVDISAGVIKQAAITNEWVEYKVYDGNALPYPDKFFKLVYTINVMHHVPPELWLHFLQQIKRVLQKDGVFIVFEHNPINLLTRYVVSTCQFDKNIKLLQRKLMMSLIKRAGMQVKSSMTILTIPHLFPIMRWLDLKLGRLPFGTQYFILAVPDTNKKLKAVYL